MRTLLVPSLLVTLVALPSAVAAQARGQGWRDTVPYQMLPPAGKCRIWMEGVPAAQQPAPTDCATALRQRPSNGVVLYGPAPRDAGTERFDPKAASTTKPKPELERGGSAAEQELRRLREVEERRRRMQELRERDERARRETEERALGGTRARTTGGASAPRTGTGTATPRGATTGSSTAPSGSGTGSSTSAEPASKAPPEGKRKPE